MIAQGSSVGPSFGQGRDLYISSDGSSSGTNFPTSYTDTLGRGNATFTGARDYTAEDYEVWTAHSFQEQQAFAAAAFQKRQAAAAAAAAFAKMGLSGSALLQRVWDGNKAQQFAALLSDRLPGMSYRLLYTWSRDGRSGASFHQHCDNQVCSRAFVRSAAARVTAGAGAHARHRALHHEPHVRRLRERAVEQHNDSW
jgi:hypothetical protein